MKKMVPPDPETTVSQEHYAVIYAPSKKRHRFPKANVSVYDTLEQAQINASPENKRYAAKVLGPSKSSEGQYLFYLLHWITEEAK